MFYEEGGCDWFEKDFCGFGSCISSDFVVFMVYYVGWKDMVVVLLGYIMWLVLYWMLEYGGDFLFDVIVVFGYLWYCYILDYEDNDMMCFILLIWGVVLL